MKVIVTKDSQSLKIDDACLSAWEQAGWKLKTEEKAANKETKASK